MFRNRGIGSEVVKIIRYKFPKKTIRLMPTSKSAKFWNKFGKKNKRKNL